jgi:AraC-like DNA-binding protein
MSPKGHSPASAAVRISTFELPPGRRINRHVHDEHQVAWARTGVLIVITDLGTWVLPPTRALWIPSGVEHEIQASGSTLFRPLYLQPDDCPITWPDPQPVTVVPVLAELVEHLATAELDAEPRIRAEAVLYDLLEPADQASIDLPWPVDPRAREVAVALLDDPADPRSLPDWGRQVGAGARTLARAFRADTGLGFQHWRTTLRLRAALPYLAGGDTIATAARRVGYQTPSAFVAAFHRETGLTPGVYFHSRP